MKRHAVEGIVLLCVAALLTCGPVDGGHQDGGVDGGFDGGPADPGTPDGGQRDAGSSDAGLLDSGALDAGSTDAGGFDAGLFSALDGGHGHIVGTCGRVAAELGSSAPSYFEVHLDFGSDQFDDPQERPRLTPGAQQILQEGTAGGSSGLSEAFAFEVLALCEHASFVKSETLITYNPPTSKKTDILVSIAGQHVGVSVTRAVSFPPDAGYAITPARVSFLEGKLDDILISSANVVPPDNWVKQILLVMAYGDEHAATIHAIWNSLDAMTRADTVLYVVVTDGEDSPIYF